MRTFNPILETEKAHCILGVPGRYLGLTVRHDERPDCFCSQKWISEQRPYSKYHKNGYLRAKIRFDDSCRNGHNTFSIVADASHPGTRGFDACGCLHEDIAKVFPELADLIKWHLVSSDGPMYYEADTIYHADEHGPDRAWVYFDDPANGISKKCMKYCTIPEALDMCSIPSTAYNYVSRSGYRYEVDPKTAKVANLNLARSSACWPEATDEELTSPGLRESLQARLPKLLEDFQATIAVIGFRWSA